MHKTGGEGGGGSSSEEMNFTFSGAGGGGAGGGPHFVSAGQFQGQVGKLQQAVGNGTVGQVVGVMGDGGMQYVRTLEGGAALQQATPQIITLPIALPGAKPGDPQQTMQIQVLGPNLTLQQGVQQPKYHMQIPIQGFQQGGVGAVLTVAYAPEGVEGLQLMGNSLPEGVQVVAALQQHDLQMLQQQQQDTKDQQAILIPNTQQVMMQQQQQQQSPDGKKITINNNISNNTNNNNIIIKEECDNDTNDDESSELGGESNSECGNNWQINANQEIANYLSKMPQQQALPVSLQQFLRLNPECVMKREVDADAEMEGASNDASSAVSKELSHDEEATLKPKKKKKYKKKPLKPARPKPGQVVIAQAMDGTPIYCCPECNMAYPEKEQLEMHLSVHKIERRFICGICGAGLKRKEHLERHKLGHNPERPFVCSICDKGFKRKEHLNLHTVIHSGEKSEVCQECGKGFYRKDHLRKHARSHQSRRARDENPAELMSILPAAQPVLELKPFAGAGGGEAKHTVMPEITIHVPTSANMQVPVQISVPHHIVSTLPNGQQHITVNPSASSASGGAHHINVEELFAQQS